ncbi:DUF1254 domain-containing protein [soil metagenome]
MPAIAADSVTPAEIRAIIKDAYVYGFPMVDNYRILYAYFVDSNSPQFKAPWNQLKNFPRVFTPEDTAIQTPNSDTPYSFIGMDLRAEPLVLTVPVIEQKRYFAIQFVDLYTFNYAYIGSRTTGNDGGSFLVAGPNWKGEKPIGVKEVIYSESELGLAGYRTQLFNPDDIDNVEKIQSGYKVQTLSQFLGKEASESATAIDFVKPLTPDEERTSPRFFSILNFILEFCPPDPSEKALMARFAKLGIGAGQDFDPVKLSAEQTKAVQDGMADAWQEFALLKKQIDAGEATSGDLFGTREYLKNNYLNRMAAAVIGIYGNSKQEAMYPMYFVDQNGEKFDCSKNSYSLRFGPDQVPPVNAFWSLTLYKLPSSLLFANPISRYLINSPMMPELQRDKDGGVTLCIQHDSPGKDKEPNWLPAPSGPFFMALRLYWPKEEALDGKWKAPAANSVVEIGSKKS